MCVLICHVCIIVINSVWLNVEGEASSMRAKVHAKKRTPSSPTVSKVRRHTVVVSDPLVSMEVRHKKVNDMRSKPGVFIYIR